ncbi:MAG: sulfotransferase domain-containing protein [Bacteroidia bacterium]
MPRKFSTAKRIGLFFRGLTSAFRSEPEFIIAGVQKGGTTSLFAYLDQHPSLKLSRPKEVHFFDDRYEKGMAYYRRFFPLKIFGKRTGEASPFYIFHPHVAKRIKRELPNCKIIIVLRNPILRAYSHYQMECRQGNENLKTFEEAIDAEHGRLKGELDKILADENYFSVPYRSFSYASRGMYAPQVKQWIDIFGKSQIHFIKSENLLAKPEEELKKVYTFLELKQVLPLSLSKKHVHNYPEINKETLEKLKVKFENDQKELTKLIGGDFSWF